MATSDAITLREFFEDLAENNDWDHERRWELLLEFIEQSDDPEPFLRFIIAEANGMSPEEVEIVKSEAPTEEAVEHESIIFGMGSRTGDPNAPCLDDPSPPGDGTPPPGVPPVDRYLGCLLGGALGDALGYPVEFVRSAAEIVRRHGEGAPERLDYAGRPALISDDTQMTLFTAEGLIRGKLRWADRGFCNLTGCMHRAYLRWRLTQGEGPPPAGEASVDDGGHITSGWLWREPRLWHRRDPGETCLSALASEKEATVEAPPNDRKGCGAVMRSAPFGLVMYDREGAFREARDAAVLTHGHPSGYLSAAYFASVVFDVSRGMPLGEAMREADGLLARETGHEESAAIIAQVRTLAAAGRPTVGSIEAIGEGWVAEEALGIALLCALTVTDSSPRAVAESLWRSVAHAGDSDSTGSLTGNLLGAMFGVECLPTAWLNALELRDVTERLARDLHAASSEEYKALWKHYPTF